MAIPTFRAKWLRRCFLDPQVRRGLAAVLENPMVFYGAALLKAVPGGHSAAMTLRLRDGSRVMVRSFMTLYIFEEIFVSGIYDEALSAGPRTIIDIGANTGLFTLRAKQLSPGARILAYEPEPANFAALQETIAINKLQNVIALQEAVAAQRGTLQLYLSASNIGAHSTVFRPSARSVAVPAVTLGEALERVGGTCDVLKIDAEGGEIAIIGAVTPALAARIGRIVYETDPAALPGLAAHLTGLGFNATAVDNVSGALPTVLATREA